jgi:hypothetical protein
MGPLSQPGSASILNGSKRESNTNSHVNFEAVLSYGSIYARSQVCHQTRHDKELDVRMTTEREIKQ